MSKAFAPIPRFIVLSGLAAAISGCAGTALQSSLNVTEQKTLSGELTTRSNLNLNNGSRYDSYGLRLSEGQAVQISESESLSTQLTLIDSDGRLVAGPGTDNLTLVSSRAGTYTLGVSGATATDYGPYSLTFKPISARSSGALSDGDTFAGLLTSDGNTYQLTVENAAIYTLKMASDVFDTHLSLQGSGVNAENDDSGDGTNSRLNIYLQPGTYQVRASGIDDSAKGAYTLEVQQRKLPDNISFTNSGTLTSGQTITGLVSMAPASYHIELKQASRVQLEMRSGEIDALLTLSGNRVEFTDDDSAGGTDAKLSALLLPGRYKVEAKSINDQSGLFELSYNTVAVSEGRLSALRPGQFAQGTYSQSRSGRATLVIPSAGDYVIDLASSNFDVVLQLSGQGLELQDDDSGGGTNARIQQYLEAGEYQVNVGSVDESGGRFVLSVQAD